MENLEAIPSDIAKEVMFRLDIKGVFLFILQHRRYEYLLTDHYFWRKYFENRNLFDIELLEYLVKLRDLDEGMGTIHEEFYKEAERQNIKDYVQSMYEIALSKYSINERGIDISIYTNQQYFKDRVNALEFKIRDYENMKTDINCNYGLMTIQFYYRELKHFSIIVNELKMALSEKLKQYRELCKINKSI